MKQQEFEQLHNQQWRRFEEILEDANRRARQRRLSREALATLPALYRQTCNHYAIACQRGYSPHLQNSLHHLVLRGHQQLYAPVTIWLAPILQFVVTGFPRLVRKHAATMLVAAALFFAPAAVMGLLCWQSSDLLYSIVPSEYVAEIEYMYDPTNGQIGRTEQRQSETNIMMFGYYIFNNVGIGFRVFASGILLGVGAVVALISNGLTIGGVAGHLTRIGYTDTFWPFVAGHSAFELTAIALSGGAGLLLARTIFAPGRFKRADALRRIGIDAVQIVIGAASMLTIAAFIEAFWSSSAVIPPALKFVAGTLAWATVLGYLLFGGLGRDED